MFVGIIGHGPENFGDRDLVQRSIRKVLETLRLEQGSSLFCLFNGDIGVGQWACSAAMEMEVPYGLYLIDEPESLLGLWYPGQVENLQKQSEKASAIYISKHGSYYAEQDMSDVLYHLVDDCNFLIAFWNGKKQGKTFNAIKYALKNNKQAFNAYNSLDLVPIKL